MKTNIDLIEFEKWVSLKYSSSYRNVVLCYVKKYHYLLKVDCYVKKYHYLLKVDSNLRELELLTNDVRSSVVKSLLLFSKFNGCYSQFRNRLNEYGIKLYRPDSLNAF